MHTSSDPSPREGLFPLNICRKDEADPPQYYDMAKYEFRMNLIRSGQTVPLEGLAYDPMADIKAHSSFLKVGLFTHQLVAWS
jgi:hypothetical protein